MKKATSIVIITFLLTNMLALTIVITQSNAEQTTNIAPYEIKLEPMTQSPIEIAYAHGAVYHNDYLYFTSRTSPGKIAKVNPNNYSDTSIQTVTRNDTYASPLYDLIAESNYLWTIDSNGYMYKLDPTDLRTLYYCRLFQEAGQALCSDGTYIFATGAEGWIAKYQISNEQYFNNNVNATDLLHSAVTDNNWLWTVNNCQRTLYKINMSNLQVIDQKNIGYLITDDIAQDADFVYLPVENSIGQIIRVRKSDLTTYTQAPSGMGHSYGAFITEDTSARYLLYLDKDNNKIWVFITPSLQCIRVISLVNLNAIGEINELTFENDFFHITQWKDSPINLIKLSKSSVLGIDWNPADVNRDLKVDIFDVIIACSIHRSNSSSPNWNPLCDLAEPYGTIDIFDIVVIATSYGEEWS